MDKRVTLCWTHLMSWCYPGAFVQPLYQMYTGVSIFSNTLHLRCWFYNKILSLFIKHNIIFIDIYTPCFVQIQRLTPRFESCSSVCSTGVLVHSLYCSYVFGLHHQMTLCRENFTKVNWQGGLFLSNQTSFLLVLLLCLCCIISFTRFQEYKQNICTVTCTEMRHKHRTKKLTCVIYFLFSIIKCALFTYLVGTWCRKVCIIRRCATNDRFT